MSFNRDLHKMLFRHIYYPFPKICYDTCDRVVGCTVDQMVDGSLICQELSLIIESTVNLHDTVKDADSNAEYKAAKEAYNAAEKSFREAEKAYDAAFAAAYANALETIEVNVESSYS